MIPSISFFILLLLLLFVASTTFVVDASWITFLQNQDPTKVTIATIKAAALTSTAGTSITIYARNMDLRVFSTITNDKSVFPGQCTSDVEQLYGWNTYKSKLLTYVSSVFVTVNGQKGTQITLSLSPRIGYSTVRAETITCTIEKPNGEDQHYTEPINEQDKKFSFVITPHENNQISLVKSFDRVNLREFQEYKMLPAPPIQSFPLPTDSNDMYENSFRQNGITIDFLLNGDVWRAEKVPELALHIKCKPLFVDSAPNCLDGFITSSDLVWDEQLPSIVSLRIPRQRMRNFNIDQSSQIYLDLPPPLNSEFSSRLAINLGRQAGFVLYTMPFYDKAQDGLAMPTPSSPNVTLNQHLGIVYLNSKEQQVQPGEYISYFSSLGFSPAPSNTITVSEDCIRGKISDLAVCPRTYLFTMPLGLTRHRFTNGVPNQLDDIRRYALTSRNSQFPWADFDWLERWLLRPGGANIQGLVWMKGLPEYETSVDDEITINVPFSSFTTGEPMVHSVGGPLTIRVTPSNGSFIGDLHDINQSDIWFSNVSMCLKFGGESFKSSFASTLISSGSRGNISFGWDAQKSTLMSLPGAKIAFANFSSSASSGKLDRTQLCFTLGQNPDYEMVGGTVELVTFGVNTSWTESGLPLQFEASASFRIFGSPGEYTLDAASEVEEATIKQGGFKLRLELAGQKFVQNIDACKLALCAAWNSSSSAGVDAAGWRARNSVLCSPFASFDRIDNRTLQVTLQPDPDYDTIRGETITTLVPEACVGGVMPKGRPTFRILPQNGNISFEVSYDGGQSLQYADATLESSIRGARLRLYVRIFNDTWDSLNPNVPAELLRDLRSLQNEAYGWNSKKAQLVKSVTILNATHVQILLQVTSTYDITNNETLELTILPSWVSSKRAPRNPTVSFRILASAGDVTLRSWTGSAENRDVNEDDVRWGRVWFSVALSGDQWRRDVQPYVNSFKSDQPSNANALHRLIPELVPSMRFFKFSIDETDGSEVLTLKLQSSSAYDISMDENVTLKFDRETVASGIAPMFFVNGRQQPSFSFVIKKTPGRIFLSGEIYALNEKKMRQSQRLKIYLTLLGDTWKQGTNLDNTTSAIVENLNAIVNPYYSTGTSAATGGEQPPPGSQPLQQNGFLAFKASIIPKSRVEFVNNNVLLLHFMPNRNYEIESNEYLEAKVPGFAVNSGFAPFTERMLRRLVLEITPTGGELRIVPDGLVLEESQLRDSNYTVLVAVDGDRWAQSQLLDQSVAFVASAFGSLSSPIKEPRGFAAMKADFLNIGGNRRPFLSSGSFSGQETLQVRLNPVSTYDISSDETIVFSVIEPIFLTTGFLPEPNRLEIPVRAARRVIVVIIEQVSSKAIAYRTNLLRLKDEFTKMIGVPADRQNIVLNATAIRPDGKLAVLVNFLPAETAAQKEADPRSVIELSDTFLSLSDAYLYRKAAIRFVFRQDQAPPESSLVVTSPPAAADLTNLNAGFDYTIVGVAFGCVFIFLMAVGFVVGLRLQRARVTTSAIKSSRQRRREVGSEKFHDDAVHHREQAIELSVNPRLRNAGNLLVPAANREHVHWDADEDLFVVPDEPQSLRDRVRSNLGMKDPALHVEELKEVKRERDKRLREMEGYREQKRPGIYEADYYFSAPSSAASYGNDFYTPRSPVDSKFGLPTEHRREFKITNRSELKRLERLMSV